MAVQHFRALFAADIRALQSRVAVGESAFGIVIIVLRYARCVRVQVFRGIRGLKISSREVLFSGGVLQGRIVRVVGTLACACSVCARVGAAAAVEVCAVVVVVLVLCCGFVFCAAVQCFPCRRCACWCVSAGVRGTRGSRVRWSDRSGAVVLLCGGASSVRSGMGSKCGADISLFTVFMGVDRGTRWEGSRGGVARRIRVTGKT